MVRDKCIPSSLWPKVWDGSKFTHLIWKWLGQQAVDPVCAAWWLSLGATVAAHIRSDTFFFSGQLNILIRVWILLWFKILRISVPISWRTASSAVNRPLGILGLLSLKLPLLMVCLQTLLLHLLYRGQFLFSRTHYQGNNMKVYRDYSQ